MRAAMECHPMFCSVYLSLMLMTAGFVLTLCSWLTPPLNDFVEMVRVVGLACLLVGSIILSIACLIGSLFQGKCFPFCYACESKKPPKGSFLAQSIESPFLTTAILGSTLCTEETSVEASTSVPKEPQSNKTDHSNYDQAASYPFVIENTNAKERRQAPNPTVDKHTKRKHGYQLVPSSDASDFMITNNNAAEMGEMESTFIANPNAFATDERLKSADRKGHSNGTSSKSETSSGKTKPPVAKKYLEPPPSYCNVTSKDIAKTSRDATIKHSKRGDKNVTIDLSSFPAQNNPTEYSKLSDNRAITSPSTRYDDNGLTSRSNLGSSRGSDCCQSVNMGHKISTTFPATSASPEAVLQPILFTDVAKTNCDFKGDYQSVHDSRRNLTPSDKMDEGIQWKGNSDNHERKPTCHGKTNSVEIKVYEKYTKSPQKQHVKPINS